MSQPYNAAVALLADPASAHPDRTAVVTRERSVTYGELNEEVARLAGGLQRLGVQPEQRVAMVVFDCVEFYDVFLGAMRAGAVPVPVNPLLPARDLAPIIASSRARVLIVSPERTGDIEAIRRAAPELQSVVSVGSDGWLELVASEAVAPYATWADSPGFWLCTSGSTGTPKLAMHRHVDLETSARTYAEEVLGVNATDRCYSAGPMFHAYGLGNSLSFPLAAGATAIVDPTRPPTPGLIADTVRRFRPTLFFGIPTLYAALLASDLPDDTFSTVRCAVSAAEPLPADLFGRFRDRFGVEILDGIGSTEMTHIFISNRPGDIRPGTSGRPVAGYDVAVLDDAGLAVADGSPGHLHVGGPTMAAGYWCAWDTNRRTYLGPLMKTGDMYTRSADGYLTYLGRSDDMLRVAGEWVSPAEVEATLIRHPAVLEAAVVGERDELGVLRPVAFVVPAPTATLDIAELEALCRRELAGYKRPRLYEVRPELPKTATGKIQRYLLRREESRPLPDG